MDQVFGLQLAVCSLCVLTLAAQRNDIECESNICPNQERCFQRNGPGNITYMCNCSESPYKRGIMGHNCMEQDAYHTTFESCYGSRCESQWFTSPNYPKKYQRRYSVLFNIYIPHATAIHFQFSAPFCIEVNKDELYVGKGLKYSQRQIDDGVTIPGKIHLFDNCTVPDDFSLLTDMAWILFITDSSTEEIGFNISWTSEVDYIKPNIVQCPDDIEFYVGKGVTSHLLSWTEPSVLDNEEITTTQNFRSRDAFPIGKTKVNYTFSDIYKNEAMCEFTIDIVVDDEPPVFHNCPVSQDYNITYPNTTVNVFWAEPNVTDNSDKEVTVKITAKNGDNFTEGIHEVDFIAVDTVGNSGHCTFTVEVSQLNPLPTNTFNELIPITICGVVFTIISCVFCLGRAVTRTNFSSTRSNQGNSSETRQGTSSRHRTDRDKVSSSGGTFSNSGFDSSDMVHSSSSTTGYFSSEMGTDSVVSANATDLQPPLNSTDSNSSAVDVDSGLDDRSETSQ